LVLSRLYSKGIADDNHHTFNFPTDNSVFP
jgi:hypothetical protein